MPEFTKIELSQRTMKCRRGRAGYCGCTWHEAEGKEEGRELALKPPGRPKKKKTAEICDLSYWVFCFIPAVDSDGACYLRGSEGSSEV